MIVYSIYKLKYLFIYNGVTEVEVQLQSNLKTIYIYIYISIFSPTRKIDSIYIIKRKSEISIYFFLYFLS